MITKKEALEGSIKKWEDLLNSKLRLGKLLESCSLCDYTAQFQRNICNCNGCPLFEQAEGCGRYSTYVKIRVIFLELEKTEGQIHSRRLNQVKNNGDLKKLIEEMLAELKELETRNA